MKTKITLITITIIFALTLCSTVTAADTPNMTPNDSNQSLEQNEIHFEVINSNIGTDQNLPDPKVYHNGAMVYSTTDLQDAIDHSVEGDLIEVEPGNYNQATVNKRVTINATGPGTIVAGFIINGLSPFTRTNWLEINGFTITSITGPVLQLQNAEGCRIINNTIIDNPCNAVSLFQSSWNIIDGNNISSNQGYGINLDDGSNDNIITGNTIQNNQNGISLANSESNTISGNNITDNLNDGIYLFRSDNNYIDSSIGINEINNNKNGISLDQSHFNSICGNDIIGNNGTGFGQGNGIGLGGPGGSNKNTITGNIIMNNLGSGVSIWWSSNNTISTNFIINCTDAGIRLEHSTNNTINEGNTIIQNHLNGIYLRNSSSNNTISDNILMENFGSGIRAEDTLFSIINNNIITGSQQGIPSQCFSAIILIRSSDNLISGNTLEESRADAMRLSGSNRNLISENDIINNVEAGIHLMLGSSFNTITDNNITLNLNDGIFLEESNNNTINRNNISNNGDVGIFLDMINPGPDSTPTDYNQIFENIIQNNAGDGIQVGLASNNTISGNTVSNNGKIGINMNYNSDPGPPPEPGSPPEPQPGPIGANFNQIIANTIQNNIEDGIHIGAASHNTISENTISGNNGDGIALELLVPPGPAPECSFNEINGNIISNNIMNGIAIFSNANNNNIFENTITGNHENGIIFAPAPHNGNSVNFNRIIPVASKFAIKKDSPEFVNAECNWWGSNNPDFATLISGTADFTPWLVMKYSVNPNTIKSGQTSALTADFRYDSDGVFHDPALGHLPDEIGVTFTTNLGNVGSKSTVIGTLGGMAIATLRGDEAAGDALTSASLDNQLPLTINVIITPSTNAANETDTGKTIKMQETGMPIAGLILVILMVFGGLFKAKRK